MPRDVFISHSAQDKKVAETICGALEQGGIQCWVAPRDVRPGRSFPGEITRAIQQNKVLLMIFSRHSNSSEQVLREVQLAVGENASRGEWINGAVAVDLQITADGEGVPRIVSMKQK